MYLNGKCFNVAWVGLLNAGENKLEIYNKISISSDPAVLLLEKTN